MAGSTYYLYTTVKCGLIRLGTHKRRQERVMYVDYLVWISRNHTVTDNLHVTRQNNEINIVLLEQIKHSTLLLLLVFLGYGIYIIRYSEHIGHMLHIGMVAHNQRNLHVPLACAVTCQQVEQAV